jgi:hypothetical protein
MMNRKVVVRNTALMLMFCGLGLVFFTENIRIVQVLGLFVSGVGFGASMTTLIFVIKSKQVKD